MDNNLFEKIAARYMAGEKVTQLAKEAGISWQKLHGMLHRLPRKQQQSSQEENTSEGKITARNPVVQDADGVWRITFDSVGQTVVDALADYAQNETNRSMISQRMEMHMSGRDTWANCFTRVSLLDAIANPPKNLLEAVEDMRRQLMDEVAPPQSTRRKVRRNQDWGDELDAESVLVRSLNPWDRMTRENQPRRSVTIGVNLTVNCGQKPYELLWRGAAAAALADILTQRGVNVEIVAFWTIEQMSNRCGKVVGRYIIKSADMPMDIGSVSVAIAEIAYARLVALYGLARHVPGVVKRSLGYCTSLPEADRAGIDYYVDEKVTRREVAEEWLRQSANHQESEVLHV